MGRRALIGIFGVLLAASPAPAQSDAEAPVLRATSYTLDARLDLKRERMRATARVRLRNETARPVASASLLLYRLLQVSAVRDSAGARQSFTQSVTVFEDFPKLQVNRIVVPLRPALPVGAEVTLELDYSGHILGYAETGRMYIRDRIDTTFAMLRMDAYAYPQPGVASMAADRRAGLPVFDYTARITVPSTHTVANGGRLVDRISRGDSTTYVYRSLKPSWRMDFAVARFATMRDGELVVYHLPADSAGARRILGTMSRTLDLYTRWFGPLRGRGSFSVIEIPDGWGSQADVTSILQTAAAFNDARRESELFHELSHLWNGSTEVPMPRWDEGLATFLEDVTADSLNGTRTTDSNAVRIARWIKSRIEQDSLLSSVPLADYGKQNITGYSYWVGSLMFHGLYRLVGHDDFCRIIGEYYRRYGTGGGSSARFALLADEISSADLAPFFDRWMFSTKWTRLVGSATLPDGLYQP